MTHQIFPDVQPESERLKWYHRSNILIPNKVEIIEDFIGNGMTLFEVAKKHNVSYDQVCRTVTIYFKKPKFSLTLSSKI